MYASFLLLERRRLTKNATDITENLALTSIVPSEFHTLPSPLIYIQYMLKICLKQKCFKQPIIILAISLSRNQKRMLN